MPLVSIIIPTFNRGHVLAKAVHSIVQQTHTDWEIIIVDDGSADNTREIVRTLQKDDNRIRFFQHQENRGAQAARNTGITASRGKWIAFLDSDDQWLPESLDIRLAAAASQQMPIIHSGCYILRENEEKERFGLPAMQGNVYSELLTRPGPMFQGLLIQREALSKINGLDEAITSYQEWDTAIRLARHFQFGFVDQATFLYDCRGDDTISQNLKRDAEGYTQVFNKHFWEVFRLKGPAGIARHYHQIARRYRAAGIQNNARYYRAIATLWWPLKRAKNSSKSLKNLGG